MRQLMPFGLVTLLALAACESADGPPRPESVPKPRLRITSEENLGERGKSIELLLFDDGSAQFQSRERVPGAVQPDPVLVMQFSSLDEETMGELEAAREAVLLWQEGYRPAMAEPWPRRDVYFEHIEPQETWTTVIEGVDRAAAHPDDTPLPLVYRVLKRLDEMLGVEADDGWRADIVLQRDVVVGGEDVVALLRMRNHADESRELWYATGCQFHWWVEDSDGNIHRPGCLCTQAASVLRFMPGQGQVFLVRVSTHDHPWPPSSQKGLVFGPGRYTLHGGCLLDHYAQADFIVESRR